MSILCRWCRARSSQGKRKIIRRDLWEGVSDLMVTKVRYSERALESRCVRWNMGRYLVRMGGWN